MNKKNGAILAALGVVFGDIGTSPLYALKECFNQDHGLSLTPDNILGVCSLIFWAMTLVIIAKYLMVVLQVDNNGEGGTMSMLALLKKNITSNKVPFVVILGIFGTALLYGDGIITPAISVLSALEGITVVAPGFKPYIVPLALSILVSLFLIQKKGTNKIGTFFGPILVLWFSILAITGAYWIYQNPAIVYAINPWYAVKFFMANGLLGFLVLSAVVLVITGGEALYADLGHFGRDPITKAWFWVVYPALVLNYLGQGALLLTEGSKVVENPFFSMVNGWMVYPLVFIATLATIIASQALITGAFSLTQQAIRLGYIPRIKIIHTSRESEGQIYIPKINYALMVGCILLVLFMKESSNLAAAYGIAATGTMTVSTILLFLITQSKWKWGVLKSTLLCGTFLIIDLSFLGANLVKIGHGGWIPLSVGCFMFWVMLTWRKGRIHLSAYIQNNSENLTEFIDGIKEDNIYRNKGTAIFMSMNRDIAPFSLVNNLKHNNVIHEQVAILNISTSNDPEVPRHLKVKVEPLKHGFYIVKASYGFMEMPDVQDILSLAKEQGFNSDLETTSFFLGREFIVPTGNSGMFYASKKLFSLLTSNSQTATDFFKVPQERVIEIGGQVKI